MTTVIRQWPDPLFYLSTAGGANLKEQVTKLVQSTKRDRTIHDAQTVDSNGDEQQDVLQGISFGNLTQRHRYRLFYDHDNARIVVQRNTGTDASKVWSELLRIDASGNLTPAGALSADSLTSTDGGLTLGGTLDANEFYLRNLDKNIGQFRTDSLLVHGAITGGSLAVTHASTHKNGGSDEVATGTPGANLIPKANSSGKLADGWISSSSVLQHVGTAAEVDTGTDAGDVPLVSDILGKQTVLLKAAAFDLNNTTNMPAPSGFVQPLGSATCGYSALDFDQTTVEYSMFDLELPSSYDGGAIEVKLRWTANSTLTTNVRWHVGWIKIADGATLAASISTQGNVTDDHGGTAHFLNETAYFSIGAGGAATAGEIHGSFIAWRQADAAGDTFAADARLISITARYVIDNLNDS